MKRDPGADATDIARVEQAVAACSRDVDMVEWRHVAQTFGPRSHIGIEELLIVVAEAWDEPGMFLDQREGHGGDVLWRTARWTGTKVRRFLIVLSPTKFDALALTLEHAS